MKKFYLKLLAIIVISFLGITNTFAQYCTSNATSTGDEEIFGVSFASMSNPSTCASLAAGPGTLQNRYSNYVGDPSVIVPFVAQSLSYPFVIEINTCGGLYNNYTKIFIDYNRDSIFDVLEEVFFTPISINGIHTITGSITIPSTADTGLTVMRVVNVESSVPAACGTYTWGETEDYAINIIQGTACVGTPTAGLLSTPSLNGCPGINSPISVVGYTAATGITLAWQSSLNNVTFTATGDSGPLLNTIFPADTIYYFAAVSCNGGPFVNTDTIMLVGNPIYTCYCNANLGTSCNAYVDGVEILGTTLNNQFSNCSSPGYISYFPTTASTTAQLQQAVNYVLNVNFSLNVAEAAVWLDLDGSGSFDASEFTQFAITGGVGTANLYIDPLTAVIGKTGMRIRTTQFAGTFYINPNNSCGNFFTNGEVEDYVVDIIAGVPCSGAPTPGTISANIALNPNPCPNTPILLSLSGQTAALNINLDWEESTDGGLTWVSTGNSTLTNPTNAPSAPGDTIMYRVKVDCNGGTPVYTNIITVIADTNFLNCYCTSSASSTFDEEIFNVTFAGINNTTNCSSLGGPGSVTSLYNNYTNVPSPPIGVVAQALSYPISLDLNTCNGNYVNMAKVFIDWNRNGDFSDPGEEAFVSPSANGPHFETGIISVPSTNLADTGLTLMRIVHVETSFAPSITPCGTYTWGETEDYLIRVIPGTLCSGAPTPGTLLASLPNLGCPGSSLNISVNGYTQAVGITLAWEESLDGVTFTATGDSGALFNTFYPTDSIYYRVGVSCNGGPLVFTDTIKLIGNPIYVCYCNTNLGTSCNAFVNGLSIAGTPLNNQATGCTVPGYISYYPTTTSTTAQLQQAVNYIVTANFSPSVAEAAVWIDLDGSGAFDAAEFTQFAITAGVGTASVYIDPLTAVVGKTGMRIRTTQFAGTFYINPNNACGNFFTNGEVEDYVVDITPGVPCSGIPTAGTISSNKPVSPNPCAGTDFILTLNGTTAGLNVNIDWEESYDGGLTWSSTGSINLIHTTFAPTIGDSVWVRAKVDCNGGTPVYSDTVKIVTSTNFFDCYCTTNIGGFCNSSHIEGVQIVGTTLNNQLNGCTAQPAPINGAYTKFNPGPTTTGTVFTGLSYTFNINLQATPFEVRVYIDYDHSGSFDPTEDFLATITGPTATLSTIIPASALTGLTGMRVRSRNGNISTACQQIGSGETEDYVIDIQPGTACTGTPSAGTINVVNATGCPGSPLNLTLVGYTLALNINTEWEESLDSINWTATGDTTPAIASFYPTDTIYYRVKVDCNGGTAVYTPTLMITGNPIYSCYCNTNLGTACNAFVDGVSIAGTTLNTTATGCTNPGYSLYFPSIANTTGQLQQALTYTVTANFSPNVAEAGVWIDLDASGAFDAAEFVQFTISGGIGIASVFIDPSTSVIGKTGMRIRTTEFTGTFYINPSNACGNFFTNGEVEDYVVDIIPGIPCGGTILAGTVSTVQTNPNTCPNSSVNFVLTGNTQAVGINIDWEESYDGGLTWTSTGVTTNTHTAFTDTAPGGIPLQIRAKVDCSAGTPVYSNIYVLVTDSNTINCHCTSIATSTFDEEILAVRLFANGGVDINNTSTCATTGGPGSVLNMYSNYTALTPGQFQIGGTYNLEVEIGTCNGTYSNSTKVYIDLDRNGTFDLPQDEVYTDGATTIGPHITNGTITIPSGSSVGLTRMRVVNVETSPAFITPCGTYTWGETEDYFLDMALLTNIKAVSNNSNLTLSAYPNPTDGILNIALTNKGKLDTKVEIVNAMGQTVYNKNYQVINGYDVFKVNMSSLANGTYTIKAIDNNEVKVIRVVVQH